MATVGSWCETAGFDCRILMIKNIQALRGVAVILVLLAHLSVIERKYYAGTPLLPEFMSIGISGVDLFFVISGFVMVSVTRGWHSQPALVPRFLFNRVSRIFPLYWIYSLLVLVVFLLRPSMVNSSQGNQVQLLESFLLLPLPQGTYPLLGVGWSLIHEMYFYFVFAIFVALPERYLLRCLSLWAIFVPLLFWTHLGNGSPTFELISHPLTVEFIGGCLIAKFIEKSTAGASRLIVLCALLWWLIAYAIFASKVGWGMAPVDWRRLVVFGIPAALFCYGLVSLELLNGKSLPRWLCSVGDWSYSIYLSHLLVISVLGRMWGSFNNESSALNFAALAATFMSAVAFGWLSYRHLEVPIQKWTRKLSTNLLGSI
jgi:peptidoglycan/LPS O-acetylase OafA/YrhL